MRRKVTRVQSIRYGNRYSREARGLLRSPCSKRREKGHHGARETEVALFGGSMTVDCELSTVWWNGRLSKAPYEVGLRSGFVKINASHCFISSDAIYCCYPVGSIKKLSTFILALLSFLPREYFSSNSTIIQFFTALSDEILISFFFQVLSKRHSVGGNARWTYTSTRAGRWGAVNGVGQITRSRDLPLMRKLISTSDERYG